jgi:DNA-binding MarR family transcriptional regulator
VYGYIIIAIVKYYQIGNMSKWKIAEMENKEQEPVNPISDQFVELMQRVIRLRYTLILPEHVNQFKQKFIESLQKGKMGSPEDHRVIMRIFVFLASREKPPTMGEISSELNTPLSTATRIIDWLVHGQIVERISDPDDRRVVRICMSETGREFYLSFLDHHKKRIERIMCHFSADEQVQFLKLSSKLLDLLAAGETDCR